MGKGKHNIPMCVALLLMLLTLVTTHMTGGLFARYVATETASDSARVAKFQVQVESTDGVLTVDCATDDQGVYTFTVTNQSEVTMGYSVTVEFKQSVPGTMLQVAMDDNPFGYLDQNNTIRFAVDETLEPLGDNAAHQLFFQVTPKALYSTVQGEASVELALDFAVIVHARQVD